MAAPTLVLLLSVLPQFHHGSGFVRTGTISRVSHPLAGTLVPEPPGYGPARGVAEGQAGQIEQQQPGAAGEGIAENLTPEQAGAPRRGSVRGALP